VLRQEATLLGSKLSFVRRSDEAAARLAATLAEESRGTGEQPPTAEAVP
jgi:hypothetical protein